MKKILFALSAIIPMSLFASDSGVETDILERTVNFFIFAAIIYSCCQINWKLILSEELNLFNLN